MRFHKTIRDTKPGEITRLQSVEGEAGDTNQHIRHLFDAVERDIGKDYDVIDVFVDIRIDVKIAPKRDDPEPSDP